MSVVFVADPLESLDAGIDTTVGLMHAVQDRGDEVWVTEARALEVVDGRARASARQVELAPSVPAGDCRWTVPEPWFRSSSPAHIWLDSADAVFMRTDPPVDEAYVNATLVLDLVDASRTAMVNDPRGLRVISEHAFPLQFPDLVPPTVISADAGTIRAFVSEQDAAVLKPIDGCGGHGVLRLRTEDPNLGSLLEIMTGNGRRAVMAQQYLAEVAEGNKRVFVVDGEPVAAVYRYPQAGDFRIGHPGSAAPVTSRDRQICARLAPALARHGVRMAGLDVIGRHLIEVNITSPGALRKADGLLGTAMCADLIDRVVTSPAHHASPRHEVRRPSMTTAIVCTAILAGMVFLLGLNVSIRRGQRAKEGGPQLPTDPADRLLLAIRAHGNAAEYVPTLVVLFLLVGTRSAALWSAALIVAATGARLLHAFGMLTAPSLAAESKARLVGALGTYVCGVALALAAAASI